MKIKSADVVIHAAFCCFIVRFFFSEVACVVEGSCVFRKSDRCHIVIPGRLFYGLRNFFKKTKNNLLPLVRFFSFVRFFI